MKSDKKVTEGKAKAAPKVDTTKATEWRVRVTLTFDEAVTEREVRAYFTGADTDGKGVEIVPNKHRVTRVKAVLG